MNCTILRSLFFLILTTIFCASASAATITVNTTVDENNTNPANCSLREAIESADTDTAFSGCVSGTAGSDTIVFSALFSTAQTIQVGSALGVNTTMTITGPGANLLTVQNIAAPAGNSRVITVSSTSVLTISGMTITGGNTTAGNGGAGVLVSGSANLTNVNITGNTADGYAGGIIFETAGTNSSMTNCTVSNNSSNGTSFGGGGAGVDNSGNLTITTSTISGNVKTGATGNGGGIFNLSGIVTITNSTITDNSAAGGAASAGGVFQAGGTVTVRNTIIAANRGNATTPDVGGAFTSSGYNMIGTLGTATGFTGTADQTNVSNTNVKLSSLGFNGGPTPTHVPIFNSFAIDKGNNFGITTDQRGATRPFDNPGVTNAPGGNGTDIGAVELPSAVAAGVSVSGRVLTESGRGISRATVYATDQNGVTRTAPTNSFGNFIFADLQPGQTYIFTVFSKQYQFDPQVRTVNENVSDLNFTPQSSGLKR